MDEPESLGAITLAAREKLDNLIFVVNCNLQRLDGPVRGNGKIIQELEAAFRGAGWNVIKVIWGADWDPLLAQDTRACWPNAWKSGRRPVPEIHRRCPAALHPQGLFRPYPELEKLVDLHRRTAAQAAPRRPRSPRSTPPTRRPVAHKGAPTVILAKTIKGYGLGEAGEGRNVTHQQKKLNEEELRHFRSRFGIPIPDDQIAEMPFYRPDDDSRR
jgi:pyruvate dehydrogenase E1 component